MCGNPFRVSKPPKPIGRYRNYHAQPFTKHEKAKGDLLCHRFKTLPRKVTFTRVQLSHATSRVTNLKDRTRRVPPTAPSHSTDKRHRQSPEEQHSSRARSCYFRQRTSHLDADASDIDMAVVSFLAQNAPRKYFPSEQVTTPGGWCPPEITARNHGLDFNFRGRTELFAGPGGMKRVRVTCNMDSMSKPLAEMVRDLDVASGNRK